MRHTWLATIAGAMLIARGGYAQVDDDVSEALKGAKAAASAPSGVLAPDAPGNKPTSDALGTMKERTPAGARQGEIELNSGMKLRGKIWTTLETPLRVWVEEDKRYVDVDLSLVSRIDVHVLTEAMEDDWRWLKEGSDQKVYSGKKYPNVELAYKFTLINGQVVEGGVVAPIYFLDGTKTRTLALYKKYKGKLDETLKDLVYIRAVSLEPPGSEMTAANEKKTTKLPLLDD